MQPGHGVAVPRGHSMTRPKGFLVAIGGNEDKEFGKAVLKRMLDLPAGGSKSVVVIPSASEEPRESAETYRKAFGDLGVDDVHVLDIRDRLHAEREDVAETIRGCDVLFITGGDQLRLTSILGGTRACEAIVKHYHNGGVVAGTSAGAAAMSATMIFEGDSDGAMRKGHVRMTPGLGLLASGVIDTHFLDRGRVSRLLEVVTSNPAYLGIGLGEDTGIIVHEGQWFEVIGKGAVVVVDGHELRSTNVSSIDLGTSIAAEHLVVHTLTDGYRYDLHRKEYGLPQSPAEHDKKKQGRS
jgi:cyanophycinase